MSSPLPAPKLPKAPPQCEHFKTNGVRCGSPALRHRSLCFFHQRAADLRALRRERPSVGLHLPLLEDANAIQLALQDVVHAVAEDRLDMRRAGLILYGLNTASANLKRVEFEPRVLREQEDISPVLQPLIDFILHDGRAPEDSTYAKLERIAEGIDVKNAREAAEKLRA